MTIVLQGARVKELAKEAGKARLGVTGVLDNPVPDEPGGGVTRRGCHRRQAIKSAIKSLWRRVIERRAVLNPPCGAGRGAD